MKALVVYAYVEYPRSNKIMIGNSLETFIGSYPQLFEIEEIKKSLNTQVGCYDAQIVNIIELEE